MFHRDKSTLPRYQSCSKRDCDCYSHCNCFTTTKKKHKLYTNHPEINPIKLRYDYFAYKLTLTTNFNPQSICRIIKFAIALPGIEERNNFLISFVNIDLKGNSFCGACTFKKELIKFLEIFLLPC